MPWLYIVTSGDFLAGVWKAIKKRRPASRNARKLCEHLQRLGVDARMIEEEGNLIGLTGQEIDIAKVSYHVRAGANDIAPGYYYVDYGVRCNVEEVEKQVQARMKVQKKGLIRMKIVDIKWVGGELADELNKVVDDALLQQFIEGKAYPPDKIFSDKKAGIVWIRTMRMYNPKNIMPSERSFEVYNAIAELIRNIASP